MGAPNFPPQGGVALQPRRPPGGGEQCLCQGQHPADADLHVERRGQRPGKAAHPDALPTQGEPCGSWVDGGWGPCRARRSWSCPSPAPSWSWTPGTPTRPAACAGTSTGSRPSTSSMPTVSAQQVAESRVDGPREAGGAGQGPRRDAGQGANRGVATLPVMPQREVSGVLSMGGSSALRAPRGPRMECLLSADARLTPVQFGNLQKLDGPTEQCQDPLPSPADNCTDGVSACPQPLQIRAPPDTVSPRRGHSGSPEQKPFRCAGRTPPLEVA